MMSEMGWDKEESGVERNNITAAGPEPIKALLWQGETFRSWGIWRQPQTLLAVVVQQQGPLWLLFGHPGRYSCTEHRKRDGNSADVGTKQPGSFGSCLPKVEPKQEFGRLWDHAKESPGQRQSWRSSGGPRERSDTILSTDKGKLMWDSPFLFCQHPPAWMAQDKASEFSLS